MDYYIGILIVIFLISVINLKIAKRGTIHEDSTSLSQAKCIQGIAAIFVIISHLSQRIKEDSILVNFINTGVLFVGIFFFYSGYGLIKSLKEKPNYLKGFLKKRLVSILIPSYVCAWIFLVFRTIAWGSYTPLEYFYTITGIKLANSHMWFICVIAILYTSFYLTFRFIKNEKNAFMVMLIVTLILIIAPLFLPHSKYGDEWFKGEWWYNTTIMFYIGMVIGRFSKQIRDFFRTPFVYYVSLVLMSLSFIIFYRLFIKMPGYWQDNSKLCYIYRGQTLIIQELLVISFVFSILLLGFKIKLGNPILRFLGKISLEVYLIHNIFLLFLNHDKIVFIKDNQLYAVMVIICSIIAGTIIHYACKPLIKLLTKKKEKLVKE